MLNLREILPEHFLEDDFVMIDLDAFYKFHNLVSHDHALQVIFAEGVRHAQGKTERQEDEIAQLEIEMIAKEKHYEERLGELGKRLEALAEKYEALRAQVGAVEEEQMKSDIQMERTLVAQTMGMGNVFKK